MNPPGSLTVISGTPRIGASVVLDVDNPLGTQRPGSLPLVYLSTEPNPAFPCGMLVTGLGMTGNGAPGELLIELGMSVFGIYTGPPWEGPGSPAHVSVDIPNDPSLIGSFFYGQGALQDFVPRRQSAARIGDGGPAPRRIVVRPGPELSAIRSAG